MRLRNLHLAEKILTFPIKVKNCKQNLYSMLLKHHTENAGHPDTNTNVNT